MEKKKLGNIVILVVAVFFILPILAGRCGRKNDYGKGSGGEYTYKEQGLDKIIKQYRDEKNYTVILYDMDYVDKQYKHQYQVLLTNTDSTLNEEISEWLPVTEEFFIQNQDNLGMELASKTDGRLQKEVAPAGYSQYVGNPQYGRWVQRDGGSFWEFYGKYAMMSSIFHMVTRPARYSYYDDYYRNYRGSYRTYRGPSGYYGTTGYSKTKKGSSSTWSKKPNTFKQSVRNKVSQSSSVTSKKKSTFGSSSRSTSKSTSGSSFGRTSGSSTVKRTSSRYSSTSSYRSRGGGYGGK